MSRSANRARRPAIFLDRDGVINEAPLGKPYITQPDDLCLLPGVAEAIRRFRDAGCFVAVVTNQRCISLGTVSEETLQEIHERLRSLLAEAGAAVDGIYVCPHGDQDACLCRKPKPGLLRRAAEELGIDLGRSWMVGDSERDLLAGRAAGCRTILLSGATEPPSFAETAADLVVCNWRELDLHFAAGVLSTNVSTAS